MALTHNERRAFWEHLYELRSSFLWGGGFFFVAAILAFSYTDLVTPYLVAPLKGSTLLFLSPFDPLLFKVRISLHLAFLASFPVWLILLYRFVAPAIVPHRRFILIGFILGSLLLGAGALAATYLYLVPVTLSVLESFSIAGTELALTASGYFSFVLLELLITFLISQLPIIILGLSLVGILNPYTLARHRKALIIVLITGLAILTPTTDILTLCIVSVPAILLSEVGITLAKIFRKER